MPNTLKQELEKVDYFTDNWHFDILCDLLVNPLITNLLVEIPPRSGNSTLFGTIYPQWFVDNHPDKQALVIDPYTKRKGTNTNLAYKRPGDPLMGSRFDLLVIDQINKYSHSSSQFANQQIIDYYEMSLATCKTTREAKTVVVGSRTSEDDLIGYLKGQGGWVCFTIPMEIGYPGNTFWPERFSPERVTEIKTLVGKPGYSSSYQQKPNA